MDIVLNIIDQCSFLNVFLYLFMCACIKGRCTIVAILKALCFMNLIVLVVSSLTRNKVYIHISQFEQMLFSFIQGIRRSKIYFMAHLPAVTDLRKFACYKYDIMKEYFCIRFLYIYNQLYLTIQFLSFLDETTQSTCL